MIVIFILYVHLSLLRNDVQIGATTSLFPYNEQMRRYLIATGRQKVVDAADKVNTETNYLTADPGSESYYDKIIEIDLNQLEPHLSECM
jgi:aconitate hydratase